MLSRRIVTACARPRAHLLRKTTSVPPIPHSQARHLSQEDIDDPNMNGGYINPPRIKRQFRDPYADWWDKQERRNYGEPVHEDNDILGMFSPEEYTHVSPRKALAQIGVFIAAVVGLYGVVSVNYADKPAVDRGFEGGLDRELGGEEAVLARTEDGID
ncbi:hypothetical protein MMC21_000653 [Puttea exsequens]|nr:hypothetical protein [Puttea exsequens]